MRTIHKTTLLHDIKLESFFNQVCSGLAVANSTWLTVGETNKWLLSKLVNNHDIMRSTRKLLQ